MTTNTRQALLGATLNHKNFSIVIGDETLELSAWELTAGESAEVGENSYVDDKWDSIRFYDNRVLVSVCEQGTRKRIFEDADIDALQAVPANVIARLRMAVSDANKDITEAEIKKGKKSLKASTDSA